MIQSGDGVYIHSNAAAPHTLIEAMTARSPELRNVKIYQLITLGPAPYADSRHSDAFYVHAMFIGPNVRKAVNEGRADYTPVFFSDLPELFKSGKLKVDVCLVSASPADENGKLTLGVSLDSTLAAMANARIVLVEVNKKMPRTHGATELDLSRVSAIIETDRELPQLHSHNPSEADLAIGRNVATLVEDGATIQMGIGAIPNAVLQALTDKRDLGVHTEMFSDGVVDLVERGVITNARKTVCPGKIAVSFAMGSKRLYDFIDDNQAVEFHTSDWINNPSIISSNYRMTSINSALEIDVTGQVCADSIGTELYSGCGGQVDFIRGASHSAGGKAILALQSTARGGSLSRIVPTLKPGAGVVTSRADVHYIVTEYGIADLHGKNLKDRCKALIAIAHPDFRAQLEEGCRVHSWLGSGCARV